MKNGPTIRSVLSLLMEVNAFWKEDSLPSSMTLIFNFCPFATFLWIASLAPVKKSSAAVLYFASLVSNPNGNNRTTFSASPEDLINELSSDF